MRGDTCIPLFKKTKQNKTKNNFFIWKEYTEFQYPPHPSLISYTFVKNKTKKKYLGTLLLTHLLDLFGFHQFF